MIFKYRMHMLNVLVSVGFPVARITLKSTKHKAKCTIQNRKASIENCPASFVLIFTSLETPHQFPLRNSDSRIKKRHNRKDQEWSGAKAARVKAQIIVHVECQKQFCHLHLKSCRD